MNSEKSSFNMQIQKSWDDMPADVALRLQQHAEQQKQKLLQAEIDDIKRMSAELNSLLSCGKKIILVISKICISCLQQIQY